MNIISGKKEELLIRLFLLIIIVFTIIIFYLPMVNTWFFSDDIHWIWASATNTFYEIFFVPERYRSMASNFTPMLGASFKTDWMVSHMDPAGYALHSIFSLIATSVVLYFFLRLYTSEKPALIGIVLFLLNPITLSTSSWFSTRHYIEGLFWALLSLYCFVRAERKGHISIAAGIFYLIASLNKEVYVMLPAIAFIISHENVFKRLKHTLPLWLGLVVYALWRLWIMGGIGGYPSNQPFTIEMVIPFFYRTIKFLSLQWFGDYYVLLYIFLIATFMLSLKNIKMLFIFLLLIIPLFPVSNILDGHHYTGRYFFHISLFLICVACLLLDHPTIKRRLLYKSAVFLTCLFTIAVSVKQDILLSNTIKKERMKAKETALTFINSQKPYMLSEQPLWFYEGLRKINRDFLGKDIRTKLVPPEDFLRYTDPEKLQEMREAGIVIPYQKILAYQEKFRKGPLTVKITLDNYRLKWDFGPDKQALYTVLRSPLSGLYYNKSVLTHSGSIVLGKSSRDDTLETVYIKILYQPDDKGGEVTSPEFMLKIPGIQEIEYYHQ